MKKMIAITFALLCLAALTFGCSGKADIPAPEELANLSEERATEALEGIDRETLVDAWGAPDGSLSGMFGDVWDLENGDAHIIVYYDGDSIVENVKTSDG